MGHETILVIGDNFRDQLSKYQRAEYASPTNPYFVTINVLEDRKRDYATSTICFLQDVDGNLYDPWDAQFWRPIEGGKLNYVPVGFSKINIGAMERFNFADWIRSRYGVSDIVLEGEDADINGKHKCGWIRIDTEGQIYEIVDRTILGGFIDWFESTDDFFKLKPGAAGIVIDGKNEEPSTSGFAGSALKGAIDFDGMYDLKCTSDGMNPLAFTRDQYVQRFGLRSLLGYGHMILDSNLIEESDEVKLFNSLSEDTRIMLANVHS